MMGGEGAAKAFRRGTHRIMAPEETLRRIQGHLSVAGITRLADVTALDVLGIPVYQAVRPASRSLSVSQGKGATPAAAKVSALMEAFELWHAEHLEDLPGVYLSLQEMEFANTIPLEALPLAGQINVRGDLVLRWHRAQALDDGEDGWLPEEMISLDFRVRETPRGVRFRQTSNGLASGNCREEALLHALCELVERHALHQVALGEEALVSLQLDSITDHTCGGWIEQIRREGMKSAVYEVPGGFGLPVIYVELVAEDLPRIFYGSGCHPSSEVALSRALSEAAQSRLAFISGARDDIVPAANPLAPPHTCWASFTEPEGESDFGSLEGPSSDDVGEDCRTLVSRLAAAGHRAFAVDLARPDLGMQVVRAFVPGLGEAHHV